MRNEQIKKIMNDYYARRRNINRPLKIDFKRPVDQSFDSIFLTGGVGDVLAVESFMTNDERKNIKKIYYATKKENEIREIARFFDFPNLNLEKSLWNDFSKFWCFYDFEDYMKKVGVKNINNCKDFSILRIFEEIKSKKRSFTGSSLLKKQIIDIEKFNLNDDFFVLLPFSTDKRMQNRDFSKDDWLNTLNLLKANKCYGVIINNGNDSFENHENIIDLTNKTTLTEAIEILKKSKGYLGIDSWLSVLASQLFLNENIQIKSNNSHCKNNAECYFSPNKQFEFIKEGIQWTK